MNKYSRVGNKKKVIKQKMCTRVHPIAHCIFSFYQSLYIISVEVDIFLPTALNGRVVFWHLPVACMNVCACVCACVCVCVSVYMCVGASPQRSKSKDSAEENVSTKGCGLYVSCALQRANNVTRVRSINNIYFSFKYLYTNTHHFCSRTSRLSMKDKKIYTRYTILCVQ